MASFKTEVQGGGYGAQGLFLKHGGQWKVVTDVYCKRGGQWVEMQAGWVGYFGNSVKFWPPDNKLGSGGASTWNPATMAGRQFTVRGSSPVPPAVSVGTSPM